MLRNTKNRGLFVVVRREGDGEDDRFRWSIYRRKTPLGVKLSEGGFRSYRAAHSAGTEALTNLLNQIQEEEKNLV
jgi:hypothetical protein